MGCFDSVRVPCPKCGEKAEFQSKGGECVLAVYELEETPLDVMNDVNRHAPYTCEKCATQFAVSVRDGKFTSVPAEQWAPVPAAGALRAEMQLAVFTTIRKLAHRYGVGVEMEETAHELAVKAAEKIQEIVDAKKKEKGA